MNQNINIVVAVDTIAALSARTLEGHIYLIDNSMLNSIHQGSENLITHCYAGQTIEWKAYAVDLQTPVAIKNIAFLHHEYTQEQEPQQEGTHADLKSWTGIVPWYIDSDLDYSYQLDIQMGEGINSILSIKTPALRKITPHSIYK